MKDQTIEIRRLSIADIDQYNELLRYAFQVTEKTLLDSTQPFTPLALSLVWPRIPNTPGEV